MARRIVQMLVTCTVETDESREDIRTEVERTLTDHLLDLRPVVALGAIFPATLRQQVQQARNDYYEQAIGHGEKAGHDVQEACAYGRVEMCDVVLAMLAPEEETGDGPMMKCSDPPGESCSDSDCPVHGEPEWDSEDSNAYVAAEEAREAGEVQS